VTYAQFQVFLDDPEGFNSDEWWQDMMPNQQKQPIGAQEFEYENHPCENVSWYQAVAFCRWANTRYHENGLLPEDWQIRLPTEYEWEAAARYPDGRKYPWGNHFMPNRANINEIFSNVGPHYLGRTSAVGIYPEGRNSVNDLHDMSGNVSEWCFNDYNDPADIRISAHNSHVLRGGSWYDSRHDARSASRRLYFGMDKTGFRPCAAPISSLVNYQSR
jgi:formylglycine-generating enzyme required for sulfatase activity